MLVAVFLGFIAIWLNEWLPQKRREIERARIIRAKEEPIRKTEKALFNATGWEITQLMVWLIENLPSSGIPDKRCQEVLALICAEPKLALIAFQIALSSTDERIKEVGILGLSSLKSIDGINPLLKDYINPKSTIYKNSVGGALSELTKIAPIKGKYGFVDVYKQIIASELPVERKNKFLEGLLKQAANDPSRFSEEDFNVLVALSTDYCDQLNNSQGTGIRHRGEDFISTIQRIKMLRDKRVNEVHKKKQRSEQGTREKADQKEQEREKYKQETFERAQRDRLRQGQQPAQRKADREKSEQHNGASVDSEINYYKILQVDVSAEPEMISAAYWLLVSKYHPAVYKGSDSSLRMRELDQAYQVLSDPEKRRRYDIILGIS